MLRRLHRALWPVSGFTSSGALVPGADRRTWTNHHSGPQ